MQQFNSLIDAILEDNGLSLEQVATICAVETDWLIKHVEEGLLEPLPKQDEWRFSSTTLIRVRRLVSLERDFDAVPELAALVADMQEEIDLLRRKLQRVEIE
jgi:chaperone modulatory protein CbpM